MKFRQVVYTVLAEYLISKEYEFNQSILLENAPDSRPHRFTIN